MYNKYLYFAAIKPATSRYRSWFIVTEPIGRPYNPYGENLTNYFTFFVWENAIILLRDASVPPCPHGSRVLPDVLDSLDRARS